MSTLKKSWLPLSCDLQLAGAPIIMANIIHTFSISNFEKDKQKIQYCTRRNCQNYSLFLCKTILEQKSNRKTLLFTHLVNKMSAGFIVKPAIISTKR